MWYFIFSILSILTYSHILAESFALVYFIKMYALIYNSSYTDIVL